MKHKDDGVKQYNFVTGEWQRPIYPDEEGPSEAWVQGWDMNKHGFGVNPHDPGTHEFEDWEDGWNAAEND